MLLFSWKHVMQRKRGCEKFNRLLLPAKIKQEEDLLKRILLPDNVLHLRNDSSRVINTKALGDHLQTMERKVNSSPRKISEKLLQNSVSEITLEPQLANGRILLGRTVLQSGVSTVIRRATTRANARNLQDLPGHGVLRLPLLKSHQTNLLIEVKRKAMGKSLQLRDVWISSRDNMLTSPLG